MCIVSPVVRLVGAKKMSREARSYVPLLFCVTIILKAGYVNSFSDNCLELFKSDIDVIEDYLSKLNLTDAPTVKMMAAGFKCPISALPFGTLKSDWSRLLLLREAQPDGSIIRHHLVRLMRILIIAYYQMEESFDVVRFDVRNVKESPVNETTTIPIAYDKSHCLDSNRSRTTDALNNYTERPSNTQPSLTTTPLFNENSYSKVRLDSTSSRIAIIKNFTRSYEVTSIIPIYVRHQNVTLLSTSSSAITVPHYADGVKNITSKRLDNCFKQPLKDIMRKRTNRRYHKVFEIIKNKNYTERVMRNANEINDRGKNRGRISPTTEEFWKRVKLPTEPAIIAQDYRILGSDGSGINVRKSKKHSRWNNDIFESFRRFYGVDKNEDAAKKYAGDKNDTAIERAGEK